MELTDRINLVKNKTTGERWWAGEIMNTNDISVGSALGYAAASLHLTHRNDALSAAREAKMLQELAAIRAVLNADPVDEAALAVEVAAVLTPAVVAALGEEFGLSQEEVEQAVRNVLRSV